ncbi:MAG: 40S ribosomal protein S3a/S1 [Nanoarchaeota archaeon]|nr:40S ribosomal protein S3a/S1 [Nanoarchaeota archaeon]
MVKAKGKKKFFEVEIPLINKTTELQAYAPEDLNKRIIRYDLTRALKGKSILLQLEVKVDGEKITTVPIKTQVMPYFLKKMVRKGTNYVEDSFSTPCQDGQIRIKPFLVTRRKVSRKVRKALREKAHEELVNYAKDKKIETIFEDLLKNSIQKPLSLKLKKIYPLSFCEIRILKVEKK